ncbi:MAG: zeta toxin family protein [Chlamydiia bacterium]|nr:zeta toxin family protein [Chlamydiia bacterium]
MRSWALSLFLFFGLWGEETFFEPLFQKQLVGIEHLNLSRKPRLIFYSGTPGMGKSTLSKAIKENFQAIILDSDEARIYFRENGYPREKLDDYLVWAIDRILATYPNGLIVLDNTVDSCFDPFKAYIKKGSIPYTLIRLSVPREIVERRLILRENHPEAYLKALDEWWQNYLVFESKETFGLYFDNSEENKSLDPFLDELERLIR